VLLLPLLLDELLVVSSSALSAKAERVRLVWRELLRKGLRLGETGVIEGIQAECRMLARKGGLGAKHRLLVLCPLHQMLLSPPCWLKLLHVCFQCKGGLCALAREARVADWLR
jgi:hypothetical protein